MGEAVTMALKAWSPGYIDNTKWAERKTHNSAIAFKIIADAVNISCFTISTGTYDHR